MVIAKLELPTFDPVAYSSGNKSLQELCRQCWNFDARERVTMDGILKMLCSDVNETSVPEQAHLRDYQGDSSQDPAKLYDSR